ncbi:hypothetical protein E4U24_005127 [Claviceps purpurea]|nr:hypothetical protein E4U24_005127 [Claviceps purpurea]
MIKRAGEGKAVDADLDLVIRLFQDKYPLTFLPESVTSRHPKLRQGESEVLEAYYSRCQSLVLRSGRRILRDFIFKFVNGLYDKDFM